MDMNDLLRNQLMDRRHKLESASVVTKENPEIVRLINEVDAALTRMDEGTYGLCQVCHEPIEAERLLADPLAQFCLDHLTVSQQRALEDDLQLASQIQKGLLPKQNVHFGSWKVSYHYEPSGLVSGDYCDLIFSEKGDLYFILGDVSGKGVAASMLMAHLHAMYRTLISFELPLGKIMERASRIFCESTLPTHYATLVIGQAHPSGKIEMCNAGHLPLLLVSKDKVTEIPATGLPVGVFCDEQFPINMVNLDFGQTLILYSDGLSETRNLQGVEYGTERFSRLVSGFYGLTPEGVIKACLKELQDFRGGVAGKDDLTIMAIRRENPTRYKESNPQLHIMGDSLKQIQS
jgi:sigma-B regulation protein RsbU (phosphoserine phosphatase)